MASITITICQFLLPAINNHLKVININSIMSCNQEVKRCHHVKEEPKSSCKDRIVNFRMFTVKILSVEELLKIVWKLDNISIEMEVKRS